MTRDNYDLGVNAEDAMRETLRGVLAANGTPDRSPASTKSRTSTARPRARSSRSTTGYEDRWLAAIDVVDGPDHGAPVCRSSLDPDADDSRRLRAVQHFRRRRPQPGARPTCVNTDSVSHTKVTQQVVSGSLSGDFGSFLELPGGSIGFAVGAEYRRETSDSVPAQEIQDGLTWNGPITPASGSFDVKEMFAEVNLPVLKDAPYADRLSFGAAFRASDYSTVGSTNAWKVDVVYAPVELGDLARHLLAGGARAEHLRAVLAADARPSTSSSIPATSTS